MARLLRSSAGIVCLALALSGCSVKFAYNNLDRLVRWQVSDYVNLNSEQREVLKREFALVHQWHRRNHLPKYAELMDRLAVQLVDDPKPTVISAAFLQVFDWADEIEAQAMPMVIEIMTSLTDEQIQALKPKLERSNKELAEDETSVDLAKAQLRFADEVADTMKTFVGRLDRQQRDYIALRAAEYRPQYVLWAAYRARFQAELLAILEKREDVEWFSGAYRKLIAERESYYGEALTAAFDHNEQLGLEIATYLFNNLSEKQAGHLVERLTGLAEDFTELSLQEV